jgi:murein DD-endopeptidase MepM/ murein hydrolase activator NlpD
MMFFNRKGKPRGSMRFVIIRDDNDVNVQQWSLSQGSFLITSVLIVVLCTVLLAFTAEIMTRYLYETKLRDMRENNASLISVFADLQANLSNIQDDMEDLEEKDKALRTYANLPPIDQDMRQVGIGGYTDSKKSNLSELFPGIEEKINNIEMDISELSRKVRLEKESYTAIYNTIKDNSQKLTSIPSIRPLNGGYLNTGIGYRNDPFTGEKRFHHGLDISANRGTAVYATANGKVVSAGKMGNYGKTIKINHGYGYHTFYAHLHEISVQRGQKILRGDIIGQVGNTGRSTASHLHYEVHYLGTPQDPEHYFLARDLR